MGAARDLMHRHGAVFHDAHRYAEVLHAAGLLFDPERAQDIADAARDQAHDEHAAEVAELREQLAGERRGGYEAAIEVMRQERLPMSVELLEAARDLEALDRGEDPDARRDEISDLREQLDAARERVAEQQEQLADARPSHRPPQPLVVEAYPGELGTLRARVAAVLDMCDREQRGAMRWEHPLPVPEWVAPVQRTLLGHAAPASTEAGDAS